MYFIFQKKKFAHACVHTYTFSLSVPYFILTHFFSFDSLIHELISGYKFYQTFCTSKVTKFLFVFDPLQ